MTLPHCPGYDIASPETVLLTVPASAVPSRRSILATPSFRMLATPGNAYLEGSQLANATQTALNTVSLELRVVLAGDTWSSSPRNLDEGAINALLDGFVSSQAAEYQWAGQLCAPR